MLALEIYINGQKKVTAGFADGGVVTAIVSCVVRGGEDHGLPNKEANLHVGGLDSERRELVDWLPKSGLAVGDQVLLRIVDASNVDVPVEGRRRLDDEQRHKDYILKMAEKFGWKVDTLS
jgi:hypothetical protein